MYYQLPNGKVVHMSIEDYLKLTAKDIQYLLSINAGEYINDPWADSSIFKSKHEIEEDLEEESIISVFENSEEIETFFEEFFPDEFEDPDPKIDLDFNI